MRIGGLGVAAPMALALLGMGLAACSQEEAPPAAPTGFAAEPSEGTTVTVDGAAITANREGDGNISLSLVQAPMLVTFEVEGARARVRVRQGDQWVEMPAQQQNTVMIGRGGASQVRVTADNSAPLNVRVTSVVDCSTVPQGTCTPVAVPEAAPAETATTGATPAPAPAASEEIRP